MPKKNKDYWQQRFDQIEQSANNQSVAYIQELEKKYDKAAREIDGKINAWYQRIAVNNNVSITEAKRLLNNSELKEFKWTVEEYIKAGQENAIDQRWMKELENASAKFHISRLEAMKIEARQQIELATGGMVDDVDTLLKNVYSDTFYRSCFEMQKGIGVGFDVSKLDGGKVSRILSKPWSVDGTNFSEKLWSNKAKLINNLDQELSRMILTGESPKKAIANIKKVMGSSLASAKRLVMTEQAFFTSAAQVDAYGELNVEEYEFVGTLDGRTCGDCGDLDGKHFPVTEMAVGINAPPMHPYCRCTTCPYFDDEFTTDGYRTGRNTQTGEINYFPANMTYSEWKKRYLVSEDSIKQKKLIEKKYKDAIMNTKKELGIRGAININPTPMDLTDFEFDEVHINSERKHDVDRKAAEYFMKHARFTLEKWNGQYVNYYSESGAVYIDVKNKKIRTAFRNKEFDSKIRKLIEVIINGRYN